MFQGKSLLRFLLLLALIATVLLVPWPGVARGYAALFRAGSNTVFVRFWFWSEGSVRFLDLHAPDPFLEVDRATLGTLPKSLEIPPATHVLDTLMVLRNRNTPAHFGLLRISSRLIAYWPTAWLTALILAKPMSWRRKGRAFLWGMVCLHVFIAFRLTVKLAADGFGAAKVYALFVPGEFWGDLLRRVEEVVVENPTATFVIPTFIWFLVAFTWEEWAAFREPSVEP